MSTVVELKLGDIIILNRALKELDGYVKVVGDKPVLVPYKFKDSVRRKIVANLRLLKDTVEEAEENRQRIIKEIADEATPGHIDDFDAPRQAAFALKWKEECALKKKVTLEPMTDDELFADDRNPIPSSVMLGLTPVIFNPKVFGTKEDE